MSRILQRWALRFPAVALVAVASVFSFALPLIAQNGPNPPFRLPDSVRMLPDLQYSQPDGQALRLDLFIPTSGDGPKPVVVFLFGGGWTGGVKSSFWRQCVYLVERGFVAASVQYRLAPAHRFPAALNDAQAAIIWLRSRAKDYSIDASRIAIGGGSSGGHLAALVGTNAWSGSDWSGAPANAQVQAVVALCPVSELSDQMTVGGQANIAKFLGATFEENPGAWEAASPINQVSKRAAPFLILHGNADKVVPYEQSVDMLHRLQEAGVRAELFTAEGGDHPAVFRPPWFDPANAAIAKFLDAVLRTAPAGLR